MPEAPFHAGTWNGRICGNQENTRQCLYLIGGDVLVIVPERFAGTDLVNSRGSLDFAILLCGISCFLLPLNSSG